MTMIPEEYIHSRQVLERVEVVGPVAHRTAVMDRLQEAGYRIIRAGPYTNSEMFPRVDSTRFQFVAELELCQEKPTND